MGKGSPNLCTPCPKPSDVALGRCRGHPAKTFWSVELLLSGLGWGLCGTEPAPGSCPPSDTPQDHPVCFQSVPECPLGCAELALFLVTPIDVSGVALVESGEEFGSLSFYSSPLPLIFWAPQPNPSPACPGLPLLLGWELLLCSSCCLAQLRCFVSNLGSEHICSAFCFLPPSSLAVKHFIIQTLWKVSVQNEVVRLFVLVQPIQ